MSSLAMFRRAISKPACTRPLFFSWSKGNPAGLPRASRATIFDQSQDDKELEESLIAEYNKSIVSVPEVFSFKDVPTEQQITYNSLETVAINRFQGYSQEEVDAVFPEGLPTSFKKVVDQTETGGLLYRQVTHDALEEIKARQAARFSPLNGKDYMLFDGYRGTGKSFLLLQIVHWARTNDWLVLYFPEGASFAHEGIITPSPLYEGMYNEDPYAVELCDSFILAHEEQFKQLPIRNKFKLPNFEGETLFDLLDFGSTNSKFASDALVHFRAELNRITDFPVMIVMDDINMFYNDSFFGDPMCAKYKPDPLPADKLVLPHVFGRLNGHGLRNGLVVAATNRRHKMDNFLKLNYQSTAVEPYNLEEYRSVMRYYEALHQAFPPLSKSLFPFYNSSGIGWELFKMCIRSEVA